MALYGYETKEYKKFSQDKKLKILMALRSKKTSTTVEMEIPENLAERLNNDKNASAIFAKMRPSCQKKYNIRAHQIKNPSESSKMDTIIREIIRYGENHQWL
jgi:uncharacterized protein YdeI (YjbR/CyaY-like superfamily)